MKRIEIKRSGAVECSAALELPLPATSVWGQIRDFHRYAQQDFFHADLEIEGGMPRPGARLKLTHRYAGVRIARAGRILVWREGIGFSYSDLSRSGPRHGFPHVLSYRLEPVGAAQCRLHVSVRGRWTARRIPRPLARLWLRWVFSHLVRSVQNELLIYQFWRKCQVAAEPIRASD
jgi:hypothetical protein